MTAPIFDKTHIENKNVNNVAGYNADEFYSLIESEDINRKEILEGLNTSETLIALLALTGENKDVLEVVKELVIEHLDGTNILSIQLYDETLYPEKDFIELCYLGWVIENKKTITTDSGDFLSKAQEFYKKNVETKETNEILVENTKTKTELYNPGGYETLDITNNVDTKEAVKDALKTENAGNNRTVNITPGIDGLKYKTKTMKTEHESVMKEVTDYYATFKSKINSKLQTEIDDYITQCKEGSTVINFANDQGADAGNQRLLAIRALKGLKDFMLALYELKNNKNLMALNIEIELKLETESVHTSDGTKIDNIRKVEISITNKVEEAETDDTETDDTETDDTETDDTEEDNTETEEEEEDKETDNTALDTQIELQNKLNQDLRRLLIAQYFGEQVDNLDAGNSDRHIKGFSGLNFSNIKETNIANSTDKEVTFTLNQGRAYKGRLTYDVTRTEITAIKHKDGSYSIKNNTNKTIDGVIILNIDINIINRSKLGLPLGITVKTIQVDKLTLTYAPTNIIKSDKNLDLEIKIDPNTGKLAYTAAKADALANVQSERVDITPIPIDSGVINPAYKSGDNKIKFYARIDSNGKLQIINNLKKDDTYYNSEYQEILATQESYKEVPNIFLSIYRSTKNESKQDELSFTDGISVPKKLDNGKISKKEEYIYKIDVNSNSGAETYKISIPYKVVRDGDNKTNNFENAIVTIGGKKVKNKNGSWLIDGVFYDINTSSNRIELRENEAKTLKYLQSSHPNQDNEIVKDIQKNFTSTNTSVSGDPEVKASTQLPTFDVSELILNPASADKYSSSEQTIDIADQDFIIHYDENGALTYIIYGNDKHKKRIAGGDMPQVTIENYVGGKPLKLSLAIDDGGKVKLSPEFAKDGFENKEKLAEQIYKDKLKIYNAFENIRGVLGDDQKYFKFPVTKNIIQQGGNLDTDWGKNPDGTRRFKGPDRKGIYTVSVIQAKDRWNNASTRRGKKPDFELHFKLDENNTMKLVDLNGKDIIEVEMPLEHSSDTKLHKNYKFSIDNGSLKAVAIDKKDIAEKPFLYPGTEINITGESKQIKEVIQSSNQYTKVLFSDNTIGTIFMNKKTSNDQETYKGYSGLGEANTEIKKQEGKILNLLFKNTLVSRVDNMNYNELGGYSKDVIKKYISTLGSDLKLLDAINGLSTNANDRYDFVPLVVDNKLEMGAIGEGESIENISKVKKRKLREAKLEKLITQISYLKKAEDISLDYDNSKGITSGLFMYRNAETLKYAREQILKQGMTEDVVLIYKLSNGIKKNTQDIKIKMGVQTGERFTVTNNPIKVDGWKYTISYHKKTKKNNKEKANKLTVDSAEKIDNSK